MEPWLIAVLLSVSVGLVFGLYVVVEERFLGAGVFMFFIASAASFLIMLLVSVIFYACRIGYTETYSENSEELRAITTSAELGGRTYLLGGYFSEVPVYRYFTGTSEEGYVLDSVNADVSTVFETNNIDPTIVFTYRTEDTFFNLIGPETYLDKVEIFVPVGSVVSDYTLEP